MLLDGSCHCGSVRFTVHAPHPYPFNLCYCSICRKSGVRLRLSPAQGLDPERVGNTCFGLYYERLRCPHWGYLFVGCSSTTARCRTESRRHYELNNW